MKQIIKNIWGIITIPFTILNGILFVILWFFSFRISNYLDERGIFDSQSAIKDMSNFMENKVELGNHLKFIYLIVILLIIYLK